MTARSHVLTKCPQPRTWLSYSAHAFSLGTLQFPQAGAATLPQDIEIHMYFSWHARCVGQYTIGPLLPAFLDKERA